MEDINKAKKVLNNANQNIKEFGTAKINISLNEHLEYYDGLPTKTKLKKLNRISTSF